MQVKIKDKEYDIEPLNLNDWINLEGKVGNLTKMAEDLTVSKMRYILWYVLKKQDSKLTEEQVGEMFVPGSDDFNSLIKKIMGSDKGDSESENPT